MIKENCGRRQFQKLSIVCELPLFPSSFVFSSLVVNTINLLKLCFFLRLKMAPDSLLPYSIIHRRNEFSLHRRISVVVAILLLDRKKKKNMTKFQNPSALNWMVKMVRLVIQLCTAFVCNWRYESEANQKNRRVSLCCTEGKKGTEMNSDSRNALHAI